VRLSLAAALAAAAILTASSASAQTPADEQLAWVLATVNKAKSPPPPAELRKHFTPAFLKAVPPDQLVEGLASIAAQRPFRIAAVLDRQGSQGLIVRIAGRGGTSLKVSIHVTGGLIDGLLFQPIVPTVTSWSAVDTKLRKLAANATLYAGTAGGTAIHSLAATRPGAIGSAFKLYVLGALADAVDAGKAKWADELAINTTWKSLPSGAMRNEPAGKRFTLRHYAEQMISVSDNTAADHLIHFLGRPAVEAQLAKLGNSVPARNEPFLTTRELFALKLTAPAKLRNQFAAAGTAEREKLLPAVDALGLKGALTAPWPRPIDIGSIEWFASPRDLAHAIAALAERPGEARSILAINPGIQLDRKTWSYAGYKGGSEPGVISLTWYLVRHDGKAFVLSIVLNDPHRAIDETGAVAVAEAAVGLLAKSG
jgi:hypothetical protein